VDPIEQRNKIIKSASAALFGQRLIENNFRGTYTEFMVAEALGGNCEVVSEGWHAWDLQIGPSEANFPERIRIQVKNTARLQTWHAFTGLLTECAWQLKMRPRPSYFDDYNVAVPCEDYGHLCDVYVLCHHPLDDPEIVDHRNPSQWEFYVVPVAGEKLLFEPWRRPEGQKNNPSYTVRPATLRKGIRGRKPIEPLSFERLTERALREALGI